MAGAPVGEIDATLLTLKTRSDRPVWGAQFREPAVAGRPRAVACRGRLLGTIAKCKRAAKNMELLCSKQVGKLRDQGGAQ